MVTSNDIMLRRTHDKAYVKRCLTNEHVWRMSAPDALANVKPSLFFPSMSRSIYYVKVEPDLGILMGIPLDQRTYDVHIALLPEARGKAATICKKAIQWMFANEECERIVAGVPSYNRLAIRLAHKVGMSFMGRNKGAFAKNSTMYDVLNFEIRRA